MPLIKEKRIASHSRFYVWEMSESREELLVIADPEDAYLASLDEISHAKRRRELLALKAMLRFIGFDEKISYLPNGKPVVNDTIHISISHCDQYAGFLVSDCACGLDIQNKNEKIALIAPRFCSLEELGHAESSEDPLAYFTALWSIKEAVFKVFGEHLAFAEEIHVQPFNPAVDDFIKVRVSRPGKEGEFEVRKEQVDGYFAMMAFLE